MTPAQMTAAIRRANPALSRFDPLDRIIYHADFGRGHCGFTATIGNYEGSLDTILADMNFLSPQLSGYQMWDTGTGGSIHGGYSLKLATRPVSGSVSAVTKRLSIRSQGLVRLEAILFN
jgi:hypothetical protein